MAVERAPSGRVPPITAAAEWRVEGTDMDIAAIIRLLHDTKRLNEMAHVTTFEGERVADDGEAVNVRVAILDYGPDLPESRYMVVAEDDDGAVASGEAAASIEEAIRAVDWSDFVFEDDEDEDEDE
jgi:hypothetical protein